MVEINYYVLNALEKKTSEFKFLILGVKKDFAGSARELIDRCFVGRDNAVSYLRKKSREYGLKRIKTFIPEAGLENLSYDKIVGLINELGGMAKEFILYPAAKDIVDPLKKYGLWEIPGES